VLDAINRSPRLQDEDVPPIFPPSLNGMEEYKYSEAKQSAGLSCGAELSTGTVYETLPTNRMTRNSLASLY